MLSPRMFRWSIFLNGYQHTLHHRPGKQLGHVDGPSRLPQADQCQDDPSPAEVVMLLDVLPESPVHADDVAKHSAKDAILSRVLNWVWKGQHELSAHKECLLWGDHVVIPQKLRFRVLKALHVGHPGIVRMKALARSYVWWPGMDAAIEEWVRRCLPCQETRPEMPRAPVHPWETTRTPWSCLHIDFAGPFQGQTFLIVVDSYSKWLEVIPMSSMTLSAVITTLRRLFATHGLPDTLVTDNGPQFTSTEFRGFLYANLIHQATSAPFYPSTNGQAERMVRTTKEALSRIIRGSWAQHLADFTLQQHVTPHTVTGRSPCELLMGRQLSTMLARLHTDRAPHKSSRLAEALPTPRTFQPDDPVFVRNYSQGPPWVPAVISRATGPISYEVVFPDSRMCRRDVDQLRRRGSSPMRLAETVPEGGQPEVRPASSPSPVGVSCSKTPDPSETEEQLRVMLPSEEQPRVMLPSDDTAAPQPATTEQSVELPGPRRSQRSRKTP
ncbi:uncharacterized protein K02A2.6-like [Dermacentor silvarum]|uniref:uncharacterized protein K02A2.6-like n=1 Tax=Dermacentor silvarum TaxID=543639 RepID=UPI0021018D77|nr:uncharacterized protein K02A2.6-like [Dermacentor silvarum]